MRKASYTVEAAFIMPLLLGIIFVIMYVTFLLHDQVVLQGNFSYVLCRMAEEDGKGQEDYKKILSQKLWIVHLTKADIKSSMGRISGEVEGKAGLEIPVLTFFMREGQSVRCKGEYYNIQPEQVKVRKKASGEGKLPETEGK